MNHETCVDIIIPIYNGAKYIPRLFVSLLNQTYSNFRLIIAYDTKTTDNSLELLTNYSENLSIIIDKECDSSLGAARNRGFKLATAEFIVHIDVDDELSPNYLSSFITEFKQHPELDAICCTSVSVNEYNINNVRSTTFVPCPVEIYTGDETLYKKLQWTNGVWVWMVRRDYLSKHNISSPNYSYGEDAPFVWEIIGHANKIGQIQNPLYYYWMNSSSMMHSITRDWWELYSPSLQDITSYLESRLPAVVPFVLEKYHRDYIIWASQFRYKEYLNCLKLHNIRSLNPSHVLDKQGRWKVFSHLFNISPLIIYILINTYRKIRMYRNILSR